MNPVSIVVKNQKMNKVSQLFSYPVKSMQGVLCTEAHVTKSGFSNDRQFMLTTPTGELITAKEFPSLLSFKTGIIHNGITITAPDKNVLTVYYHDFSSTLEHTRVWGNMFTVHIASITVNRWLSEYIHQDVQLRWLGEESTRRIKKYPTILSSFSDSYPFLLINQSSINMLQQRCATQLSSNLFRANIVVTGEQAFAEDRWKTIQIGDITFELIKPCSRYMITILDPKTGIPNKNNEPLSTLRSFRLDNNHNIDFGHYLIALNEGKITINASVNVIKQREPKHYLPAKVTPSELLPPNPIIHPVTIHYAGITFIGNTQQILLEQFEAQGLNIPYSCRSGRCGACRVRLKEGQVRSLNQEAVSKHGYILCCSCIPLTNLVLE